MRDSPPSDFCTASAPFQGLVRDFEARAPLCEKEESQTACDAINRAEPGSRSSPSVTFPERNVLLSGAARRESKRRVIMMIAARGKAREPEVALSRTSATMAIELFEAIELFVAIQLFVVIELEFWGECRLLLKSCS